MNLISRIKNLYKLSEYVPGTATDETKTPGTEVAMIVKKPEPAKFIPYSKIDPITQLINEPPHE